MESRVGPVRPELGMMRPVGCSALRVESVLSTLCCCRVDDTNSPTARASRRPYSGFLGPPLGMSVSSLPESMMILTDEGSVAASIDEV